MTWAREIEVEEWNVQCEETLIDFAINIAYVTFMVKGRLISKEIKSKLKANERMILGGPTGNSSGNA